MNSTLIQDLETELDNGTIKLIDFMIELADSVFDGISDSTMHEYLIDEGYFADSTELLEYYDNN
tara:strand:- start:93 stop:284 length:192 start_codon:yes stop_codon:yes gene_type:complete